MSTQEVNVQSLLDALRTEPEEDAVYMPGPMTLNRKDRRRIRKDAKAFRKNAHPEDRILEVTIIDEDFPSGPAQVSFLIPVDERSEVWHVKFNSGHVLNTYVDEAITRWANDISLAAEIDGPNEIVFYLETADGTCGQVRTIERNRVLDVEAGVERFAHLLGCEPSVLLPLTSFSELTIEMIDEICEQIGQDYEDDAWRDVVISRLGPKGEA